MVSFATAARQADSQRLPVVEAITVHLQPDADAGTTAQVQAYIEAQLAGEWRVEPRSAGWVDFVPSSTLASPALDRTWDVVRNLNRQPGVDHAEPFLVMRVPGTDAQEVNARLGIWGAPYDQDTANRLAAASTDHTWSLKQLKVPQAWDRWSARYGTTRLPGDGIHVAHPDTGYTDHPQILTILDGHGKNFVDPDRPNDAKDDLLTTGVLESPGHGTGTASVLASPSGEVGPANDVLGVAPGSRVRPLRVSTSVIHLSFRNLVLALEEAIASGAHVVSMSLGGPVPSDALQDVIQRCLNAGIIVVSAAGNFLPVVVFPAALRGVIACAASNALRMAWHFSGFGDEVATTAPGERVWHATATLDQSTPVFDMGQGDGTSHATASVAGLAALWLSFHGRDTLLAKYSAPLLPFAFHLHLKRTADATPEFIDGGKGGFGAGIASADGLLDEPPARAEVEAFRAEVLAPDTGSPIEQALRHLAQLLRVPTSAPLGAPRLAANTPHAPGTPSVESVSRLVRELLGGEPDDVAMVRELTALIAGPPLLHRNALAAAQQIDVSPPQDAARTAASEAQPANTPSARAVETLRQQLLLLPVSSALRERLMEAQEAHPAAPTSSPLSEVWRRYAPEPPAVRRLRAFAFDPSLAIRLDTTVVNAVTIDVPFEERLEPGPVGDYLEVVDVDPATGCAYPPVNLNHPALLAQDGLPRSEGNPQFHQQMVYAVAMKTIHQFEHALGRPIFWSPLRAWRGGSDAARIAATRGANDDRDRFIRRLRLYPHALREANAYYSPDKRAVLFGYFPSQPDDPGEQYAGGIVFTCLSHDIIAHEMTHAVLDGMHVYFTEATNPDVFAFHEAFADIVALLQHFTYPEVLRDQIAQTRGDLTSESLLGQLAQEFGRATGQHHALRDAIGGMAVSAAQAGGAAALLDQAQQVTPAGASSAAVQQPQPRRWMRYQPNPFLLPAVEEAHARGAILVAAVFDAFLSIYGQRVADLTRIATGGTGVLPAGQIHPDLVSRMADEAAKSAGHVLQMCIRATDYVPPVDITFGEFLRALVTADYDLVADDDRLYRVAVIDAFRRWGIYPRDVRTLSEESLRWHSPQWLLLFPERDRNADKEREETDDFVQRLQRLLRRAVLEWQPGTGRTDRAGIFGHISEAQAMLNGYLRGARSQWPGREWVQELLPGIDIDAPFSVANLRPARRVGPDGQFLTEFVFEVVQPARDVPLEGGSSLPLRGGVTVIVGLDDWRVRYSIFKRRVTDNGEINESRRLRQAQFEQLQAAAFGAAEYSCADVPPISDERSVNREVMRASSCRCRAAGKPGGATDLVEPFALLHRGRE